MNCNLLKGQRLGKQMEHVRNAEKEVGTHSEKAEQGKVREMNPSTKEKLLL